MLPGGGGSVSQALDGVESGFWGGRDHRREVEGGTEETVVDPASLLREGQSEKSRNFRNILCNRVYLSEKRKMMRKRERGNIEDNLSSRVTLAAIKRTRLS